MRKIRRRFTSKLVFRILAKNVVGTIWLANGKIVSDVRLNAMLLDVWEANANQDIYILIRLMKIGSTNKYETLNETIKKICVKFKIIFCRYIDFSRISELNGISHHELLLKNHCILVCQKYYPTEKIGPKMPYFDSRNDGIKFLCNNQQFFNWKITVMKPTPK